MIAALSPRTPEQAFAWARRLPAWDDDRDRHPAAVIAIARLISRGALRAFDLEFRRDGRVIGRLGEGRRPPPPGPDHSFPLLVGDEPVRVTYTPGDFAASGTDHFAFESPHDPPRPHPLSLTGHWSHFADRDAVEACGGPVAYATAYADARRHDAKAAFEAAFHGPRPAAGRCTRGRGPREETPATSLPAVAPPHVLGEHTARVIDQREANSDPEPPHSPSQRALFD